MKGEREKQLVTCNDNHKGNIYRIYTKGNEKEIKTYHYKKINKTQRKTAKEGKDEKAKDRKLNKVIILSPFMPVITLYVKGLNISIQRLNWLAEWMNFFKKQDSSLFCLQEIHYRYKDSYIDIRD